MSKTEHIKYAYMYDTKPENFTKNRLIKQQRKKIVLSTVNRSNDQIPNIKNANRLTGLFSILIDLI